MTNFRNRLLLLTIAAFSISVEAATPRLDHFAPALFELEPNARYASTDLTRWEVFTRTGVQLSTSLTIEFVGVDGRMKMEGVEAGNVKLSIFHGNDPSKWKHECTSFSAVAYRGLYPGIDLVYRRLEGKLKGDFIVQPGADVTRIRFRFAGASVRLQGERLSIATTNHEMLSETIPAVYEPESGRPVHARYRQYADGSIGFVVTGHDPHRQLIIDPDLAFSSFLAGSLLEQVNATVYSAVEGNLLVAGWTESSDLYGANSATFKGATDGFYGRFAVSSSGAVTLSSMTLFGGTGNDKATSIAVSPSGFVAIGGSTSSTNFPVQFPYQSRLKGSSDGFIIQFYPFGTSLLSSTYFGGTGTDQITGVAVDANNAVYFAGTTSSTNLPVTSGALQSTFRGGSTDGFAGMLNPNVTLGYSTYLGGSGTDSVSGLALLGGEVYLTGATDSSNFPTSNAFQATSGGGQDAFVTKLNYLGLLSYSTYLGGNGGYTGSPETGTAITVNSAGEAYVAGTTSSTNFPIMQAAQAQGNFRFGVTDAFLSKLNASGGLSFSTYWGGSSWDQANAITLLPSGYVAIAGMTSSLDFPVRGYVGAGPGPTPIYDGSAYGGSYDAFVAVFSPAGALYWSTYFGGAGADSANSLTSNPGGEIFLGGSTGSYNLPKVNAFQTTISSAGYHGFLARIGLQKPQHGTFRSTAGQFYLVRNADFVPFSIANYTTLDWSNVCPSGTANTEAIPVVGDWDNSGRQRLGLFMKSTGTWYLDINGDDLYTPGVDRMVSNFGAGAYPVVGDWDNTGHTRLGYFVGGGWFLDINGNNVFEYGTDWFRAFGPGPAGAVPVVGDWTNTGRSRLGVFYGGLWYLDINGNFDNSQPISAIAGAGTDNPIFADWDNSGIKRIGNFRTFGYPQGWWFVDINGDFAYSGTPIDKYYIFGGTGDTAVVGVRSH